jgi:hypothetical protein
MRSQIGLFAVWYGANLFPILLEWAELCEVVFSSQNESVLQFGIPVAARREHVEFFDSSFFGCSKLEFNFFAPVRKLQCRPRA